MQILEDTIEDIILTEFGFCALEENCGNCWYCSQGTALTVQDLGGLLLDDANLACCLLKLFCHIIFQVSWPMASPFCP